ncbi:hypothetical protein RJ639_019776 [Escallonia herrerae]|uniref:CCHC-type domain-containing protein n=1 Tax=Escallonia herrerae TaxID=1293975 RepID=A0AA89AJ92_9ASTE|nr:hypothetical protein RJ639_019776 [Escallonia herrerae]
MGEGAKSKGKGKDLMAERGKSKSKGKGKEVMAEGGKDSRGKHTCSRQHINRATGAKWIVQKYMDSGTVEEQCNKLCDYLAELKRVNPGTTTMMKLDEQSIIDGNDRQDALCKNCKKPDHFARECPNEAVCNNCGLHR